MRYAGSFKVAGDGPQICEFVSEAKCRAAESTFKFSSLACDTVIAFWSLLAEARSTRAIVRSGHVGLSVRRVVVDLIGHQRKTVMLLKQLRHFSLAAWRIGQAHFEPECGVGTGKKGLFNLMHASSWRKETLQENLQGKVHRRSVGRCEHVKLTGCLCGRGRPRMLA